MNKELEKLRRYLPKGYNRTLAEQFGVTNVTVSNSLNGKTRRFDIIQAAIDLARETQKTQQDLKKLVEKLN